MSNARMIGLVAVLVVALVAFRVIAGDDSPSKDDPAAYTQHLVQSAIERYESDGRQATIDYFNHAENADGPWYVFVINAEDGYTVAHPNADFMERDPSRRVDSTGYFYGDDILGATEEGRWVTYVLLNPETEDERRKHSWVVRHDGLVFGSGWYEEG